MNAVLPDRAPALGVRPIRLLVVDDSGFMRLSIRKMVERHGSIEVVGEARDGRTGVELARTLRPDVVTMDVEMPVMDGIEATHQIMQERPTPVIMVSSITQPNADATLRALREGAVDFVSKSSSFVDLDIVNVERELCGKIVFWSHRMPGLARRAAPHVPEQKRPVEARTPRGAVDLVCIGVSTGGPRTLPGLLRSMGRLSCPVVIAQHMPDVFTASFAKQLAQDTGLPVSEGIEGAQLAPGTVTVLRGGTDFAVWRGLEGTLRLTERFQDEATVHPSVDLLLSTGAKAAKHPVAVILTGMGDDGTRGGAEMHQRGHPVLVQNAETCVVAGMPVAAANAGIASEVLDPESLARRLRHWAGA